MTDTLQERLRRDAESVAVPDLDAGRIIAQGERRLRRRQATIALGAFAAVAVVVAGGVLAGDLQAQSQGPVDKPASRIKDERPTGSQTRKIVWSDDLTPLTPGNETPNTRVGILHVGDQEVEIDQVLHSVQDWSMFVTDSGAVYAQDDHSVWFTDGGTPQKIASQSCAVSAGGYPGLGLATGDAGPLVAWFDCAPGSVGDLVVYDTGAGREVARQRVPSCEASFVPPSLPWTRLICAPDAIVGQHVYFGHFGDDGQLAAHELRFDVTRGQVERAGQGVYDDDLRSQPRQLVVGDTWESGDPVETQGGNNADYFRAVGPQLVPVDAGSWSSDDDAVTHAFDATGDPVHFRLPSGYRPASTDDGAHFILFEWIDDDTVALAQGGDVVVGDILVCHLSDGNCELSLDGPSDGGVVVPGLPLPG